MSRPEKCQWCDEVIAKTGHAGQPPRFCSHAHRQAFWNALRKVGHERFVAGYVTSTELRERYGAKP